ncbi:MAG: sigma 54-interacting transcriptional regulator [Clostridiales Family XIII bacterium]|jgi:PAS domain S-box-containing protein|nr:sigma 54-interacting transcriptional regulator [Clostridiales Family XIII bacterium]
MDRTLSTLFPESDSIKSQNAFYKLMVEYLGEEVFVTDGKGVVIYANPASAALINIPITKLIGKSVKELIREGYIDMSSTMTVLEERRTVSVLQKLRTGKTVLTTSVPVFDEDRDKIIMVLTTSKDVDEINDMIYTIEQQQEILKIREEEIEGLRQDVFENIGFITNDEIMSSLKETLLRIAPLDVTVLIEGETGVGKDVAARAIHQFSGRRNKPYVKVNCGVIPESLAETELFGYEPGAFTGAEQGGKRGKIEIADGGTLFLDEIAELPLATQVKFLEFIQEGTFTRVGGNKVISVDVRIIAATNANLKDLCNSGQFRKDLYFRINVIPLHIPPLRERTGDVQSLVKYFIANLNTKYRSLKSISTPAMHLLLTYPWPGNVRELEHAVERIYVLTEGTRIEREMVQEVLEESRDLAYTTGAIDEFVLGGGTLKETKQEFERRLVQRAYEITGSTYKAADLLKVDQSTVVRILNRGKQGGQSA